MASQSSGEVFAGEARGIDDLALLGRRLLRCRRASSEPLATDHDAAAAAAAAAAVTLDDLG